MLLKNLVFLLQLLQTISKYPYSKPEHWKPETENCMVYLYDRKNIPNNANSNLFPGLPRASPIA